MAKLNISISDKGVWSNLKESVSNAAVRTGNTLCNTAGSENVVRSSLSSGNLDKLNPKYYQGKTQGEIAKIKNQAKSISQIPQTVLEHFSAKNLGSMLGINNKQDIEKLVLGSLPKSLESKLSPFGEAFGKINALTNNISSIVSGAIGSAKSTIQGAVKTADSSIVSGFNSVKDKIRNS